MDEFPGMMKALAIYPGKGKLHLTDFPEPSITSPRQVKLQVLQVGICGTDKEEISGGRADAPGNSRELIIGHEMLGRVVETGNEVTGVAKGDYALFSVRRGCGKCISCLNNRSDMCYTGLYTERGIKGAHGYQTEFVVDDEQYIVRVPYEISEIGVLTEPMSIVEKAIEESLSIQTLRLPFENHDNWLNGKKALVAGLGPVGLLASVALLLRGAEVTGMDIVDKNSAKPVLLEKLGGKYIDGREIPPRSVDEVCGGMNFIFEATGIAKLEFQLIDALAVNGIYVLTGIPGGERPDCIAGAELLRQMVLNNQAILGSVNASPHHFHLAVYDLAKAYKKWGQLLAGIITAKIPYDEYIKDAAAHSPDQIKQVVVWAQ